MSADEDRLDSWKDIAAYLKRDVTTVQRWEKKEGLPVHRLVHDSLGSVYAYRREVDAWRTRHESRGVRPENPRTARDDSIADTPRLRPRVMLAGTTAVVLIGFAVWWWTDGVRLGPSTAPRLGNLIQITSGSDLEDHASWSPDGRMLAYHARNADRGYDIWITQPGEGEAVSRTADGPWNDWNPTWSPDGKRIAFWSTRDGGGYYIVPAIGGAPRRVAAAPVAATPQHAAPQWTPDGRELLCVTYEPSGGSYENVLRFVGVADATVRRRIVVPVREGAIVSRPSLSPDGRAVAYLEGVAGLDDAPRLLVMRLENQAVTPITDGRSNVSSPGWTTHGSALLFVSNSGGSMDLWQQAVADGVPVGRPEQITTGVGMRAASISPDGRRIAYSRGRDVSRLWRTPVLPGRPATWDDAEPILREDADADFVDPSPDGSRVALSSDRRGNKDIYVVSLQSGQVQQLTDDPAPDWNPRFSADGRWIGFYSLRSGNRDIWVMPAAGGAARQLTRDTATDWFLAWSPDGEQIAFARTRDVGGHVDEDLWVVPVGGGDARRLLDDPAPQGSPDWSRDGRLLLFNSVRKGRYGVWVVPVAGGQPRLVADGIYARWWPDSASIVMRIAWQPELWRVPIDGRPPRQLTNLEGRPGKIFASPPAPSPDGKYVYFGWYERLGDLWVADVVRDSH